MKKRNTIPRRSPLAVAFRKLNTADFYRNLISVIIGIGITFGGSSMLQKCSERRETARIMSMVRDELDKNLAFVEEQKEQLTQEHIDAVGLAPYIHAPETIPADTLLKYRGLVTQLSEFTYTSDAFKVLKNSGQIKFVEDKNLLIRLFAAYEGLENFKRLVEAHNFLKKSTFIEYLESMDTRALSGVFTSEDLRPLFEAMMSHQALRNHVVVVAGGNHSDLRYGTSDKLMTHIEEVITTIGTNKPKNMEKSFYDFGALSLQGKELKMSDYKGKVVVVVNTASKCGFTPQYAGLQALHEKYASKGLVILGFPCNQFAGQEPGDEASIAQGCLLNYGVDFQMFSKVKVNGKEAHPLFVWLKEQLRGPLGPRVEWNFVKFVVDRDGMPVRRFGPRDTPEKMEEYLKTLL